MYKKIVVGFDGSEYSKAALAEAGHWAKLHEGKVTLVHSVYFDQEEFGILPELLSKRFDAARKMCGDVKTTFEKEFGFGLETKIVEGEAPETLLRVASEIGADLIAMGTYGRKGLGRLIMGSVTSRVIAESPCDVLVVKRPCTECLGRYESILVPYDGSEPSRIALARAAELTAENPAHIILLYIIPRYEEMINFIRTEGIQQLLYKEAERMMQGAASTARKLGISSLDVRIDEGNAADRIVAISEETKSDIIIMGSSGWRKLNRAIIGSVAERTISNSSVPVIIVR